VTGAEAQTEELECSRPDSFSLGARAFDAHHASITQGFGHFHFINLLATISAKLPQSMMTTMLFRWRHCD
jgi:hypothetical protein